MQPRQTKHFRGQLLKRWTSGFNEVSNNHLFDFTFFYLGIARVLRPPRCRRKKWIDVQSATDYGASRTVVMLNQF